MEPREVRVSSFGEMPLDNPDDNSSSDDNSNSDEENVLQVYPP